MKQRVARATLNKAALIAGDVVALLAAFILGRMANWAHDHTFEEALFGWWGDRGHLRLMTYLVSMLLAVGWFWNSGHYSRRKPFWDEVQETLKILLLVAAADVVLAFLGKWQFSRLWILATWSLAFLLVPAFRVLVKRVLMRLWVWQRPTVIVGGGENAREAASALRSERLMGFSVIAYLVPDDDSAASVVDFNTAIPVLPLGADPLATLRDMGYPHVVVAFDADDAYDQQKLVRQLSLRYPDLNVIPSLHGLPLLGMEMIHFFSHEVLMLRVRNNLGRRAPRLVKRCVDIVAASALLVLLFPLFAFIAWRIWREDGAPFIYSQQRVGRDGASFKFYKFRSMVRDADAQLESWKRERLELHDEYVKNNFKLKDDPRLLRIGRWIRRTSMDELPQLWNVLKGEMSLVGPRPLLERELEYYGDTLPLYMLARPGITGLWQISGRSETTFLDRANLDAWYVKNWSLWYDIVILLKTVRVVLGKSGAY